MLELKKWFIIYVFNIYLQLKKSGLGEWLFSVFHNGIMASMDYPIASSLF